MSVLIFIDTAEGHVKKASLEALSYGSKIAEQLGTIAEGIVLGSVSEELSSLGKYGVKKIHPRSRGTLALICRWLAISQSFPTNQGAWLG